jgi:hypothetical protein
MPLKQVAALKLPRFSSDKNLGAMNGYIETIVTTSTPMKRPGVATEPRFYSRIECGKTGCEGGEIFPENRFQAMNGCIETILATSTPTKRQALRPERDFTL